MNGSSNKNNFIKNQSDIRKKSVDNIQKFDYDKQTSLDDRKTSNNDSLISQSKSEVDGQFSTTSDNTNPDVKKTRPSRYPSNFKSNRGAVNIPPRKNSISSMMNMGSGFSRGKGLKSGFENGSDKNIESSTPDSEEMSEKETSSKISASNNKFNPLNAAGGLGFDKNKKVDFTGEIKDLMFEIAMKKLGTVLLSFTISVVPYILVLSVVGMLFIIPIFAGTDSASLNNYEFSNYLALFEGCDVISGTGCTDINKMDFADDMEQQVLDYKNLSVWTGVRYLYYVAELDVLILTSTLSIEYLPVLEDYDFNNADKYNDIRDFKERASRITELAEAMAPLTWVDNPDYDPLFNPIKYIQKRIFNLDKYDEYLKYGYYPMPHPEDPPVNNSLTYDVKNGFIAKFYYDSLLNRCIDAENGVADSGDYNSLMSELEIKVNNTFNEIYIKVELYNMFDFDSSGSSSGNVPVYNFEVDVTDNNGIIIDKVTLNEYLAGVLYYYGYENYELEHIRLRAYMIKNNAFYDSGISFESDAASIISRYLSSKSLTYCNISKGCYFANGTYYPGADSEGNFYKEPLNSDSTEYKNIMSAVSTTVDSFIVVNETNIVKIDDEVTCPSGFCTYFIPFGTLDYSKTAEQIILELFGIEVSKMSLSNGGTMSQEQLNEVWGYIFAEAPDLSQDRINVITAALTLVDNTPYFWGGGRNFPEGGARDPKWGIELCKMTSSTGGIVGQYQNQYYPCGVDCSGLMIWSIWSGLGIKISGNVSTLYKDLSTSIPASQLTPGDFATKGGTTHIGFYLYTKEDGTKMYIHSGSTDWYGVKISAYSTFTAFSVPSVYS